jgi:hypothetical protein
MNTSSSEDGDDPLREARAYNQSIYFMVAMPYLLLGAVGFKVYWEFRKRNAFLDSQARRSDDSQTSEFLDLQS